MSNVPTLLVVDDSKVSRMMISSLVKDKHPSWIIIEARDGKEALEIAAGQLVNYFSIDLNMPGIDGIEVINRLKQKYTPSKMVLMTANIQDAVTKRANDLGAACVHKPITEQSIDKMLEVFNV